MRDIPPNITNIIVAVLSSTLLAQLLPKIYDGIKARLTGKTKATIEDIQKDVKEISSSLATIKVANKYILQDRLLDLSTKYLKNGELTRDQLQSYMHLYSIYHELGGNEFVTALFERVQELPLI